VKGKMQEKTGWPSTHTHACRKRKRQRVRERERERERESECVREREKERAPSYFHYVSIDRSDLVPEGGP